LQKLKGKKKENEWETNIRNCRRGKRTGNEKEVEGRVFDWEEKQKKNGFGGKTTYGAQSGS